MAKRVELQNAFIKIAKLAELLIVLSCLFQSIIMDRKNEFLKEVSVKLNRGMLSILFLVLYAILVVGFLSNRYLGDLFLVILTLKRLGGQFEPLWGFSKIACSNERVKHWFFVTFSIIISHIKVILTLDQFFLKYDVGLKLMHHPGKTLVKKASLIRVKEGARLSKPPRML